MGKKATRLSLSGELRPSFVVHSLDGGQIWEMEKRTFEELKMLVDPSWWSTEEGQAWLRRQSARDQWVTFLEPFGFDSWFTVTVDQKKHAPWKSGIQAMGAIERTLEDVCKELHLPCDAFIVSEEFKSGLYHGHGLLRVGALNEDFQKMALSEFWKFFFAKHGRNSFEAMRDSMNVRSYVSKYITKSKNEVDWRMLGCSKGLVRR